jgi:hypothetical protein
MHFQTKIILPVILATCLFFPLFGNAEMVSAVIQTPPPASTGYFKLGTAKNPSGQEISVNSRGLLFDGKPVFPVMGEFHYSRCPQAEWRGELLKMKAGGVDIVATYVFWIHHEEIEGQWDWSGQRDLRQFVKTCGEAGLKVVVRCGPWCHGEVRNGGLPDWVLGKGWKTRTTDTNFLAAVKVLYYEISRQVQGELWKDGGPVIGIQVDNEFWGSPDYLMALKRIALDSGIDVPFYIKTGWPVAKKPTPLGELLPLFGAYADGFWERSLKPMDGSSWENFTFKLQRTDPGIGDDTVKNNQAGDTTGTERYPHLTCEVGGGMPASYHRRMNYDPRDVEAVVLTQLGGGSSMLGYYMYHGGQNPEGKNTTLQESQATGYPNDLPVKSYDFNAPLGEFGQKNPQYYWLRRLHLFLHSFGTRLSQMPATLPEPRPAKKDDFTTLRWSVRSDGESGFVFVNNYQRLQKLPAKRDVQFKLGLPGSELVFPDKPVTVPADAFFIWPFNLDLGGAKLVYATAHPVCTTTNAGEYVAYFAETPGVRSEFKFDPKTLGGRANPRSVFENVKPGRHSAIKLKNASGGKIRIVLLDQADSLALQKDDATQRIFFERQSKPSTIRIKSYLIRNAGTARQIPLSRGKPAIALAPGEADYTNAAVWRIAIPAKLDMSSNPVLRIRYTGDVARLTLNGRMIEDNFYSGREFDLGLRRYASEISRVEMRLEILPLQKGAPIYLEPSAKPDFEGHDSLATLRSVEIVDLKD